MSQAEGNSSQDATTNDQCVNTTSAASTPSTELHVTYMINKPRFVLSATRDGTTRTTLTELMRAAKKPVLSGHVGRLDYETGGLILATTDGRLNSGLRSPETHCEKAYLALVAGKVSENDPRVASIAEPLVGEKGGSVYNVSDKASARLLRCFQDKKLARSAGYSNLDCWMSNATHKANAIERQRVQDEQDQALISKASKAGKPREPHVDSDGWLSEIEVCVDQGRKHQVRRLIRRAKLKLRHLRRTRIGPLTLPPDLPIGGVREILGDDLVRLYKAIQVEVCIDADSQRAMCAVKSNAAAGENQPTSASTNDPPCSKRAVSQCISASGNNSDASTHKRTRQGDA